MGCGQSKGEPAACFLSNVAAGAPAGHVSDPFLACFLQLMQTRRAPLVGQRWESGGEPRSLHVAARIVHMTHASKAQAKRLLRKRLLLPSHT